jgi:hypothetical protein
VSVIAGTPAAPAPQAPQPKPNSKGRPVRAPAIGPAR